MKTKKIALLLITASLLTVSVVSISSLINTKRNHERVLSKYDAAFVEACRTAVIEIEEYAESGSDIAYGRLVAAVGAMQILTRAKYANEKDDVYSQLECNKCRNNLIEHKEESAKHLDLLSGAFRFYIDGNIDAYSLRMGSFNASVDEELIKE